MKNSLASNITYIGLGIALISVFYAIYDRYLLETGGMFCAEWSGEQVGIERSEICFSSPVLPPLATSLSHLGESHMLLLKIRSSKFYFSRCYWVNSRSHSVLLDNDSVNYKKNCGNYTLSIKQR